MPQNIQKQIQQNYGININNTQSSPYQPQVQQITSLNNNPRAISTVSKTPTIDTNQYQQSIVVERRPRSPFK